MTDVFSRDRYLVRRKVFKLLGGEFRILDEQGGLVAFANLKAFKLREDIRLFTGPDMSTELLTIKARQIVDISASYDVTDAQTGQVLGSLRRHGLRSVVRDKWTIHDPDGNEVGVIEEESQFVALLRRFLSGLIPQSFHVTVGGRVVARFHQAFNPFVFKLELDFSEDSAQALDRRVGVAAGLLLSAIEGRQN